MDDDDTAAHHSKFLKIDKGKAPVQRKSPVQNTEEDKVSLFAKQIAIVLRRLKHKNFRKARRYIQEILDQIEDEEELEILNLIQICDDDERN